MPPWPVARARTPRLCSPAAWPLVTRLNSWQAHAGQEILGAYVASGQIEPLDTLYADQGWAAVMPATLLPLISKDGHPYSVPVNIHRANVLWYNPALLTEVGCDRPDDLG